MGGRAGIGVFGLAALGAMLTVAGCTNVEQKYKLPPVDQHVAYPTLRPRAPTPPEPVLSPAEQKAEQARLEATGKRVESIRPARLKDQ